MNSDFVFWHRPFFPKVFCFLTRWLVSECLSWCTEGQQAGEVQPEEAAGVECPLHGGESQGDVLLAEHRMLITAEEASAGSVLIEQSSLRRGSIGLCCLLAQTDPQSELPSSAFLGFFVPEGFKFFLVSTFHLSPWARNDYHLHNYTWVCFLFLSWRALVHGLSHSSATVFSIKLSQGHPVLHHQFSPWAKDSWMLDWRLRG